MINIEVKLSGHYKLEVIRPDGEIRKTMEFDNLITNQGLDHFAIGPNDNTAFGIQYICNHCEVGTGNATPSFSDVGCQTPLAMYPPTSGSNVEGAALSVVSASNYFKAVWTYQYGTGAAAGNIAEIVTGGTQSGDVHVRAFSRALVLDAGGNPTTLTVLSDEILRVTYELRMYYPTGDTAYSADISGTTYTGVVRRCNVNSAASIDHCIGPGGGSMSVYGPGSLAAITAGQPAASTLGSVSGTPVTYIAGNHYRDFTYNFNVSTGNGTISFGMCSSQHGSWQWSFVPAIVKNNTQTLQLSFRFSWSRYTP